MASEKPPAHTITHPSEIPPEIKIMIERLNEIKEMDKSSLKPDEKRELRRELRAIKKVSALLGMVFISPVVLSLLLYF